MTAAVDKKNFTQPSVCVIAHKAYGAFCGGHGGHIGGIEWQTSMLAKWLARRGHDVSFLTWDEGGPAVETKENVRLIKIAKPDAGLKGLRFFHPKWSGLNRAMREADAQVYYQNGSEVVTGQVALWCGRHRRKFVFSAASDGDCDARLQGLTSPWERGLYRYGLRHADATIVQTETQRTLLRKNFGLEPELISMPCSQPVSEEIAPKTNPPKCILWIGRIYQVKRPDRLLELAEACTDIMFDLVGPAYTDDYTRQVMERARQTKNIVIHGAVRREGVPKFYEQAAALCCTSEYEGFPNTFLEAWSHGLPVITTFDPDSVVRKHNLGVAVNNTQELIAAVKSLFEAPARYQEMSRNAHRYVFEHHRPEAVLPKFEELFQRVASSSPGNARVTPPAPALAG